MSKVDEIINKSLDEIDAIVSEIKKGNTEAELSKAVGDEDLAPEDVSDDAPAADDGTEGAGDDAGAGDEGVGDDADVDTDAEPEQNEQEDEEVEKSLEGTLKSNDNVKKALEVSEFLDTLVKGISGDLLAQRAELSKSIESTSHSNELLAKSFVGIAKSQRVVLETQAELLKSVRALSTRLQKIEAQPQVRKSVATAPQAQVLEKAFGGDNAAASTQLSKSQVSAKLFQGIQEGKVTQDELLAFESLGTMGALSANAVAYVNSK
jgi:hypothetical protein